MTKQNLGGAADLRLPFFGTPSKPTAAPQAPQQATLDLADRTEACTSTVPVHPPSAEAPTREEWSVHPIRERFTAPTEASEFRVLEASSQEQITSGSARYQLWGERDIPIFGAVMGAAGCGKTYLVRQLAEELPGVELVATTGIAAINIGGTTINSLLRYFDTKSLQEQWMNGTLRAALGRLWRMGTKVIALDEMSMLDGDQLTFLKQAIDEVNTEKLVTKSKTEQEWEAEYGVPQMRLLLVGDFAQLPPVKAPFAFESPEWGAFGEHATVLTEVRRQADADFIHALRAARLGDAATVVEYFGATLHSTSEQEFGGVTLLAKNESVDKYNWLRLSKLPGVEIGFPSARDGEQRPEWGSPSKPPADWGIPPELKLKIGATVMVLANRKVAERDYLYVNGDLGEVVEVGETVREKQTANGPAVPQQAWPTVYVRLQRDGSIVRVQYVRREKLVPCDAGRRKELRDLGKEDTIRGDGRQEVVGWVEYLPLRVAYATTVHKSQGLSLDQVQVTLGDHFFKTPGMLYVALSRCRTPQGLRLVGSARMLAERCTVHPKLVGRFL